MTTHTNCQSCGMPLARDPKRGGTEADGTHSTTYCSYCYADGRFLQPDMTLDQMQALVVDKLTGMGFPKLMARVMARGTPKLERWRHRT